MMMLTNNDHQQSSNDDQNCLTDDGSSRHDSNNAPAIVGGNKNIKIVLSSLAQQTNLTNKQNSSNFNSNNVNNDQISEASSNLETVNKFDTNSLDLHNKQGAAAGASSSCENRGDGESDVRDEEPAFEIKPHLRGIKFEKISVPVKRGFDNSGLCSIM